MENPYVQLRLLVKGKGKKMPKRKTVEVERVREYANNILANSTVDGVESRRGVIAMVEFVLTSTANYRGFRYLDSEYASENDPVSKRDERAPLLRRGYDETRRHYH